MRGAFANLGAFEYRKDLIKMNIHKRKGMGIGDRQL